MVAIGTSTGMRTDMGMGMGMGMAWRRRGNDRNELSYTLLMRPHSHAPVTPCSCIDRFLVGYSAKHTDAATLDDTGVSLSVCTRIASYAHQSDACHALQSIVICAALLMCCVDVLC